MKHVSNEEKAKEIAEYLNQPNGSNSLLECHQAAMAMAEWKDEQFAKEKESFFKEYRKEILDACIYDFEQKKQQLIDKAADFISQKFYIGINNQVTSKGNYDTLTELIRDFTNAMKGE